LISKLSIDIADRNGGDLRRPLRSTERFNDSAIWRALLFLNTPLSKSIASLRCVTPADHFLEVPLAARFTVVRFATRLAVARLATRFTRLAAILPPQMFQVALDRSNQGARE
jgi:hypothetical protein